MLTFTALTERILENLELYGMLKSSPIYLATQLLSTPTILASVIVFSSLVLYALIYRTHKTALAHRISHLLSEPLHPLARYVWSDTRFLIPAIPIFFYAILTSMDELLQLLARALKKNRLVARALVLFFLFLLGSNIFATNEPRQTALGSYATQLGAITLPPQNGSETTPNPHVKIACRKPYLMNAIANRKATGYAWKAPDEVIADFEQKGIGIVVIDQIGYPLHTRISRPRRPGT